MLLMCLNGDIFMFLANCCKVQTGDCRERMLQISAYVLDKFWET